MSMALQLTRRALSVSPGMQRHIAHAQLSKHEAASNRSTNQKEIGVFAALAEGCEEDQ